MTIVQRDPRVRIFGSADWANFYGPTEKLDPQIEEILQGPCPFYSRKRVLEMHFAFLGMPALDGSPLTVAKWLEVHPGPDQPKFYFATNPWHTGQPHTDLAVLEPRLYVALREIVPGSTGKSPEDQAAMLPAGYRVPTTIEEVTKNILCFRRTGKRPNGTRWAACAERTVKTSQVGAGFVSCVGNWVGNGLVVSSWDGNPSVLVGVGASREMPLDLLRA